MKNKNLPYFILIVMLIVACVPQQEKEPEADEKLPPAISISENHRYFTDENGNPFFWLGDTGWLLFKKLNREDAEKYLENRRLKGFNIIQVMVLHDILNAVNVYGDSAIVNKNVAKPLTTGGNDFTDTLEYDFWDHVDYIVDIAADKGLYMGMVPVWGSNVKNGHVTLEQAKTFSKWLANRYKKKWNIVWLNGGDIFGTDSTETWKAIGNTINETDTNHLITFHPRGRMTSSIWFHNEPWLDFNMFQSGHRRYDQDDSELCFGEDNWKYVAMDYAKTPTKPTLDGEPSYEKVPQGLHDTLQPLWTDADVRRYAYWSVFAGACGFTYGHNSIMQFVKPGDSGVSYGAKDPWFVAIDHPGATQMIHIKELMLSKPYFNRIPDQSLIAGNQGKKYEYLAATRGDDFAFVYTYSGRNMEIALGKIKGKEVLASWFDPRTGDTTEIGLFQNKGRRSFDPPGKRENGNDWVLVLESK